MKVIHTFGTRKKAVARTTVTPGAGVVRVNAQLLDSLPETLYTAKVREPLVLAGDVANKVDIRVNVYGGGINAQADAIRLSIARALAEFDKKLQKTFLEYDRTLLVADVRQKERAKPNTHGKARSKRQKSYR